ncbi:endonuclease VII domain-containing protein [Flavobacterium sp.]|uniref:endonuclease VII domain-containing protein n=1 Tax=Flavobacterium sp. TaxID=239 RepID=UPI0037BFDB97
MNTKHIAVPKRNITEDGRIALTRNGLNGDVPEGFKKCYVCREIKSHEEFSMNRSRSDGLQTYCKHCGKERQSKWYYKRAHGITLEERDELLVKQDGKCAICGNNTQFKLKKGHGSNIGDEAVVDHCHESLKIRGVLCGFCNTGLGAFKDNIKSLLNAVDYLRSRTGSSESC